jgi:hypothetical protein
VRKSAARKPKRRNAAVPVDESEPLPPQNAPAERYHMADSTRISHSMREFLRSPENKGDVALQTRLIGCLTRSMITDESCRALNASSRLTSLLDSRATSLPAMRHNTRKHN